MLHGVIMAGGSGTRFWPASRTERPKQLLQLVGEATMLQATARRLEGLVEPSRTWILTNRELVPAVRKQLPQLSPSAVVGEPCKRDTAPCIGLAAALVLQRDADATMLVMPADHVITPSSSFREAASRAAELVEEDPRRIVTFGISPSYPAESFGYIERGELLATSGRLPAYSVRQFREKPTADVAAEYLKSGRYYWNGGIFVWKASTILDALCRFEPAMAAALQTIADATGSPDFEATLEREFAEIRGKSIDFAVMEHYEHVVVMEAPFDWDDLGSWQSLSRRGGTDAEGNSVEGRHLGIESRNCIVRSQDEHLIVTLGLEDCIVVHTPDATLVARRDREESIRQVVDQLKQRGWLEYL